MCFLKKKLEKIRRQYGSQRYYLMKHHVERVRWLQLTGHFVDVPVNQAGFELLQKHYEGETNFLQVLLDDDDPNMFWLRLCDPEAPGSKKMDRPSASTRSVNIALLISEMGLNLDGTKRFPIIFDDEVQATRVNLELENEKEVKIVNNVK